MDQLMSQKILKIKNISNKILTNIIMSIDYKSIRKTKDCIKIMLQNIALLLAAIKKEFTLYILAEDTDIIYL